MGAFDLPSYWVYVYYDTDVRENVANSDSLTKKEAQWYHDHWSKHRGIPVERVTLEGSRGILRCFVFHDEEAKS